MAIDIRKIAQQATVMSELMEGREKIETENIIKYYKDGITINAADKVEVSDETKENGISEFYVYTFKEEPKKFAFSGFILSKIFDEILEAVEGDFYEFKNALADGLKVKLKEGKTKGKQNITLVEVL